MTTKRHKGTEWGPKSSVLIVTVVRCLYILSRFICNYINLTQKLKRYILVSFHHSLTDFKKIQFT